MKNSILVLIITIVSCCSDKTKKYIEYFDVSNTKIRIDGQVNKDNGLEIGEWRYYDTLGRVSERGFLKDGFLIGDWHYSIPENSSLTWKIFKDSSKAIVCNYPSILVPLKKRNFLFSASNKDSSNRVNLIIDTLFLRSNETSEMYKNTLISSAQQIYNVISFDCQRQITSESEYYYLEFKVKENDDVGTIMHIFKNSKDNMVTEVNCFVSSSRLAIGKKIFSGVLFHVIIDKKRFFSPLTRIDNIIYCN